MFERTIDSWRLHGVGFWRTLWAMHRGFRRNHLDARSAQYAYYGFLIIPPLLILVIRAASHLPWEGLLDTLIEGASDSLPIQARDVVVGQIEDMRSDSSDTLLLMALAVFAVAGWRLVHTIGGGLNAAFGVEESRPIWMRWLLSVICVVAAFLLLLTSLVLQVAGSDLQALFDNELDMPTMASVMAGGLHWVIVITLVLLAASSIYWVLPSVKLRWVPLAPGSVFAALAWIALSTGFRLYKDNFSRFNETYGALAGVIVLLAWLYLSGAALFMGGQINAVLHRAKERAEP